jgi:tetratricopeptide (TPR) repeat protein
MQLAHTAGLLTEDAEIRRLADLLMFNEIPDRGAQVLEDALEKELVTPDAGLYEKLANCRIAAHDYDAAIAPLERAADLAAGGKLYVRLGEVHLQREDWAAAAGALDKGLAKGDLRDTQHAQLLMGIALFNRERPQEARDWFVRAASSQRHSQTARAYLQLVDSEA